MKRYVSTAVIAAAFFVGISLLLYPVISEYINAKHQSKAIASYDEIASHMSEADYDEIFAEARAYNAALARTEGAFYQPERVPGYLEALDITGAGIMGYVTIDKIEVELPEYHTVAPAAPPRALGSSRWKPMCCIALWDICREPVCPSEARAPMRCCPVTGDCPVPVCLRI